MMSPADCGLFSDRLDLWADRAPDAAAVTAPGRAPLTYSRLRTIVRDVRRDLRVLGIRQNEPVALVAPQGPETAVAFVAVSSGATCAPLNPTYGAPEFDFYLSDLKVRALLMPAWVESPARDVARARGIPIVDLSSVPEAAAGIFRLGFDETSGPVRDEPAQVEDVALVLHTSGTTARPKIVPLTNANLSASARNITTALALTPTDRCLDVASLFHIHGLMVALASLWSGGAVLCPPVFDATKFFEWIEELQPTWYSAVPTVHQAIATQGRHRQKDVPVGRIRFVRSSSSRLPTRIAMELESLFGCPAIEAYSMTEAAHQMTSNPLPPAQRKQGSVGIPAGPEVVVLDSENRPAPPGESGEIAIRGANVMRGYENNAAANASAFVGGWFRTGDQGHFDSDGFLFITGRLKEIINRGGEKVSPAEVDEALLAHADVAQAATFNMSHPTLGEDVGAAVVLRDGATTTERAIREFAATRLAPFKVPRRVLIVPRIPTGPTGKFQRAGLAEKLGLLPGGQGQGDGTGDRPFVAPRNQLESELTLIWQELLSVDAVSIRDNFFDLGGHSLLAVQMLRRIEEVSGTRLPGSVLFDGATVEHLAHVLTHADTLDYRSPVVTIQKDGSRTPVFFLTGDYKGGGFYCINLARHLGPDQPFHTLQCHGLNGEDVPRTIEEMAISHLKALRSFRPHGPYILGGYCNSALVAFEMARRLWVDGELVELVILIEVSVHSHRLRLLHRLIQRFDSWIGLNPERVIRWHYRLKWYDGRLEELRRLRSRERLAFVTARAMRGVRALGSRIKGGRPAVALQSPAPIRFTDQLADTREAFVELYHRRAAAGFIPRPYPGRVVLLRAEETALMRPDDPTNGWCRVAADCEVRVIPGGHVTALTRHIHVVADLIKDCVQQRASSIQSQECLGESV